MNLTKRIKCFKYLTYSYIVLLSITAGAQVVLGGLLLYKHLAYNKISANNLWMPSAILFLLGILTFVVAWFGWTATSKKSRMQLGLFTFGLIASICGHFWLCGWSVALHNRLPGIAELTINDSFKEYLDQKLHVDENHLWSQMQSDLRCCGYVGVSDYLRSGIPWACCAKPDNPYASSCNTFYQRGCLHVLSFYVKQHFLYGALISFTIAIIQFVGLFCTFQLMSLIKKENLMNHMSDTLGVTSSRAAGTKLHELMPIATSSQSGGSSAITQPSRLGGNSGSSNKGNTEHLSPYDKPTIKTKLKS